VNVPQSGSYVVVLVTCGTRSEARKIARRVVEQRLAACVNVLDARVESFYRWKGQIERGREYLLLIKTARRNLRKLQAEVERLHSYDVPEFIALPIVSGSSAYLRWLGESLQGR
jgi:periplasmic divalent cation tolerance protein